MIALCTPWERGYCAGVPLLLFEVGGLVPGNVLERVPLLGDGEMTVEQAGGGSCELLDENKVLAPGPLRDFPCPVLCWMRKSPRRNEADRSRCIELICPERDP